jgi:AbrB family looped-hinge helix DNA binding protein
MRVEENMKEIVATVTQRGQVTIPAEVRRLLGAKPYGKVAFQINGEQVRLVPVAFTLESAFGSVPPLASGLTPDEALDRAKVERAERSVRKLRGT